jgi:hypothetical protein
MSAFLRLITPFTLFTPFALCFALVAPATSLAAETTEREKEIAGAFLSLVLDGPDEARNALAWIDANWQPGMVPMALETVRLARQPMARLGLLDIAKRHTKQEFSVDIRAWQVWWWNQDIKPAPGYGHFKGVLYGLLDPAFKGYFEHPETATIDLDEIIWGGVRQDGIPPLRGPDMLTAQEATYLADDNVVFGISVNGDARAYPKRVLAWHEMFVDTVGGVPVAGVYCTLCGTVILYHTTLNGTEHALGTSGFLYRSNKLMYDKATQSMWSTMRGTPVMGELVGKGIRLRRGSVVTTTWGEWRERHPKTTVLSLETGHKRDYSEGAAYRGYFATDELMFTVPKTDTRLANKAEVLVLRTTEGGEPLAIAADYLGKQPVYHDKIGNDRIVVLTDSSGANRVYATGDTTFKSFDGTTTATDSNGAKWTLDEAGLTSPNGMAAARYPANRAFWFGWFAAFPDTRLVH